jgi:hypothetical protein
VSTPRASGVHRGTDGDDQPPARAARITVPRVLCAEARPGSGP